jgi:uncharacterized protein (DUF1778 family)
MTERETAEARIELRASTELRRLVRRAAANADLTTSEWMRRALERQAKQELGE